MNQLAQIQYPIQKQYLDRLGGVLVTNPLPIGSFINISGHTYRVYAVYSVTLTLFVQSNLVTINHGDYKLYGTAKIKRFANLLGIWNQSALIASFFHQCQIKDLKAIKEFYFCSFTEENIFQTWTS